MFVLDETDYDKKTYKNIVHAWDYHPPNLGPGEKDAQSGEKELNYLNVLTD